jgi:Holliday junction resolvasome RuvABC endonuclease subunit
VVIAGIDPGSAACGIVVLDTTYAPPRLLAAETIEVGHVEDLPKPKARKNGTTRKTKRVCTFADYLMVLCKVGAILKDHRVEQLAVECIEHGHVPAGQSAAASGSILTATARTQFLAGLLSATFLLPGLRTAVHTVPHRSWTARLGIGSSSGRRGEVAVTIESLIPEVAGRNEHVRDAAGCALWLVTPPREKSKKKSAPRTPKPARSKAPKPERACTCKGRHKRDCSYFVATNYRKGTT